MTPARLTEIRDIILRSIADHPHGNHNPTHTASREEVLELVEIAIAHAAWVLCAERMPDTDREVVFRCGDWPAGHAEMGCYGGPEDGCWSTSDIDGDPVRTFYGDEVTHWFDVPAAPPEPRK